MIGGILAIGAWVATVLAYAGYLGLVAFLELVGVR